MDCDDLMYYISAGINFDAFSEKATHQNDELRAFNKVLSAFIFVVFWTYLFIIKCFYPKKSDKMIKSSIFAFFDDLNKTPENNSINSEKVSPIEKYFKNREEKETSSEIIQGNTIDFDNTVAFPSFEKNEMRLLRKEIQLAMKKNIEQKEVDKEEENENNEVYICKFYDCCCECFCTLWVTNIYENCILKLIMIISKKMQEIFHKNLKILCFYVLMLGAFIYIPLRNILSFLLNDCNQKNYDRNTFIALLISFNVIDILAESLAVVLYMFMISFLSTQAEFLKVYLFDKTYRVRLIYFHLKKALFYGLFNLIFKILYKMSFLYQCPFEDAMESPFTAGWLIFKNIYLLLSIKFFNSIMIDAIDQDCRILRAHAQYFSIQSHLLKSIPQAEDIYALIKKQVKNNEKSSFSNKLLNFEHLENVNIYEFERFDISILQNKLIKKCGQLKKLLFEDLTIIEQQKFKNVLRNNGYLKFLPRILTILICFDLLMTIIYSIIFILIYGKYMQINHLGQFIGIGYSVISLFESSMIPFLIYYCLKKSTFFPLLKKSERKA